MKNFIPILVICFILNFTHLNGQLVFNASNQACILPNITDVLSVTAGQTKSFTKTFSLTKGFYQLSFTLAPLFIQAFTDPFLRITFNGQLINMVNISTLTTQTVTFPVSAITGCNLLIIEKPVIQMFPFIIYFFGIQTTFKPCVSTSSQNLVQNGDFELNTNPRCIGYNSFCILKNTTYNAALVTAWIPQPQMQFGHAHIYNRAMPDTIVTELDPNRNSCIKQKIQRFKAGKYAIQFIWASRKASSAISSSFSVKLNAQIIQKFAPKDYILHKQRIQFTVAASEPQNWLRFCGQGGSNTFGALIDNVKLFYLDGCS